MPFKSMFGLVNLLKEYGVGARGVTVEPAARAEALQKFPRPFLIDTADGFAIVMDVAGGNVTYMTQHKTFTATVAEVAGSWNGIALLAAADAASGEPDYRRHHIAELAGRVKCRLLLLLAVALAGFAMWVSGLYRDWAAWVVLALDCGGLLLSWMLVQKSLGISNAAAEAVCSVLEAGGCDELARSEASSFMGIFKWSEVGLAYFSVSLLAMLLFPGILPTLAAINLLCLPYTVWSITYQKFKAKVWCTLCVSVQVTLWLLFGAYMLGGWTGRILPLSEWFWIEFVAAGGCYVAALLGINRLDNAIMKFVKNRAQDENS